MNCILWTRAKTPAGYGQFKEGQKVIYAHRRAWEDANNKKIPKGLYVLHSCDVPACINSKHLSLGTAKDNAQDCTKKNRFFNQRKIACKAGHLFTEKNTYRHGPKLKYRMCRACGAARARKRRSA